MIEWLSFPLESFRISALFGIVLALIVVAIFFLNRGIRRIIVASWLVAFILNGAFASAFWFFEKSGERSLMAMEDTDESGFMGSEYVKRFLSADGEGRCGHVRRLDDLPFGVYIDTSSEPVVLCGIGHKHLESASDRPFVRVGSEYRILVGAWPYRYTLAVDIEHESALDEQTPKATLI